MPTNEKWYGKKWITNEKRLAINLRDDMTCMYCLRKLTAAAPGDITLDHIVCRSDSKGIAKLKHYVNHESNLVTACRSCNSSRGDLPIRRFASPETMQHIRRNIRRSLKPYLKLAKAYFRGEVGLPATK